MKTTITGRAKLDEDCTVPCECCGREIRHLVYLSDGQTVGTQCALRKLGYSKRETDSAPMVASSLDHANGFCAYVLVDGQVKRATRSYLNGGYSEWRF